MKQKGGISAGSVCRGGFLQLPYKLDLAGVDEVD